MNFYIINDPWGRSIWSAIAEVQNQQTYNRRQNELRLLRIAIVAILSSIPRLSNSQTSNKHFKLTRDIFKYNILSAIDSYRSHLVTRGKSIIRYVGMLRNYLKTLPSTKIVKTNFPSKNTGKGLYGYLIYLLKNDPVNIVISTSYRLLTVANRTKVRSFRFRQSATK